MMVTAPAGGSPCFRADRRHPITPRVVYQEIGSNGFNRQKSTTFTPTPSTRRPGLTSGAQQFLLLDEISGRDADRRPPRPSAWARRVTSVTLHRSRHPVSREPSATGSVSVDLGFPNAGVLLPSNLVDTTDLKQFSQELRIGSTGAGPFQWLIGAFYSDVDRQYRQRLPTPGYDAFTDARFGAGTSAAVANGFPLNSPYNADLPYDIQQKALFGEASYDLGRLTVTAGGRLYDFEEERTFKSGGLFSNGDNRTDTTKSSGFTPRLCSATKPLPTSG
jgi:iron complex outermembrane receptor protein